MNPYVSLLIMAGVALVIAIGGLVLSAIVSPNRRNRVKTANYECGIDPTPANTEHGRFPVAFYLVGITFIIFKQLCSDATQLSQGILTQQYFLRLYTLLENR